MILEIAFVLFVGIVVFCTVLATLYGIGAGIMKAIDWLERRHPSRLKVYPREPR